MPRPRLPTRHPTTRQDPNVADPDRIYDQLRAECPIAHTDRYHGMWIPTRYDDLATIAHDHQHFSSRTILITDRVESPTDLGFHAPPITEDPPYHSDIRRLLLPMFSPAVVAAYEPITRALANDLIDGFISNGQCDAAADYAQHVLIKVITRMLGIPDSDHARFRDWIHRLIEESPLAGDASFDAIFEIGGYLAEHVADHRDTPRDDIITHLLDAHMPGGRTLEDREILGVCLLLLLAVDDGLLVGQLRPHRHVDEGEGDDHDRAEGQRQPAAQPEALPARPHRGARSR